MGTVVTSPGLGLDIFQMRENATNPGPLAATCGDAEGAGFQAKALGSHVGTGRADNVCEKHRKKAMAWAMPFLWAFNRGGSHVGTA